MSKNVDVTIANYNKIASQYNKANYKFFWPREVKILKRLVAGNKILDIGCGPGRDAQMLTKQGFDVLGIDASSNMLKLARKRAPKAKFIMMNFFKLDFPACSFDCFWVSASLLHSPKKRLPKVLRKMRTILKPNGVGFIAVKQKIKFDQGVIHEEKYRGFDEGIIHEDKDGGVDRYFSFFTDSEFIKYLKQNGFKILKKHKKPEHDKWKTTWLCYFVTRS